MRYKTQTLLSAVLAAALLTTVLAQQQSQPDAQVNVRRRERLVALAARPETALLFSAYWFTVPEDEYNRLEVYCTGMAYSHQVGFFSNRAYNEFAARAPERPKLLDVAQLKQVKDAIRALTLGASEPARSYRAAQKVVAVTFWGGREYKQREYHSIYELPPGVRRVMEVVRGAKEAESRSNETGKVIWAEPVGDVCDGPEETFDAEGAPREDLMRQAMKRHLYLRQRRDLLKIYIRRFYNEKDEIDGYIKKYVEGTADQR